MRTITCQDPRAGCEDHEMEVTFRVFPNGSFDVVAIDADDACVTRDSECRRAADAAIPNSIAYARAIDEADYD